MRRSLAVIGIAALVLAGCSSQPPADTGSEEVVEQTLEEVEAAPLTAEQVEAKEPAADTAEAKYLQTLRLAEDRYPDFAEATDEQLLAAGKLACEKLAEGQLPDDISVVEGEEKNTALGMYVTSLGIVTAASEQLCS